MIADKPGTLARIADFLALGKTAQECAAAVAKAEGDKVATRMNKGIAGRGAERLNDEQKARISRLAASYVNTDFSRVGL